MMPTGSSTPTLEAWAIPDRTRLAFSSDELRELHLALALRITQLQKVNTKKMPPSELTRHQKHIDLTSELHQMVQKARGK